MTANSYAKSSPSRARAILRPLSGAGRIEIGILLITLIVGMLVGVLLDNFLLGFAALAGFALLARLILELIGSGGHTGTPEPASAARQGEHVRS